jgi:hypothetical protein
MQINWKEKIDKVRHMVDTEPSLFAFCIRDWDITEQAGLRDLAWVLARDDSYATRNDAKGLLELLEAHLTKHAPDVVESEASSELVQSQAESTSEADTTPATTQVM